MIGFGSLGSNRWKLANYLAKATEDGECRAAFSFGINLITDDPYQAAQLMREFSDIERESVSPVYHLSVSFSPKDTPKLSPERMRDIAISIMEKLDIANHYALIVGHEDKKHPHFHLMIDRRNPDTGILWPELRFMRLHYALRLVEREFGLIEVPSRLAKLPDQEWPGYGRQLTTGARRALFREMEKAGVDTPEEVEYSRLPVQLRARDALAPLFTEEHLERFDSWESLSLEIQARGFYLVPNPRGLVVTDGSTNSRGEVICVGLSRVSPTASRPKFERRFGKFDEFLQRSLENGGPYTVPNLGEYLPVSIDGDAKQHQFGDEIWLELPPHHELDASGRARGSRTAKDHAGGGDPIAQGVGSASGRNAETEWGVARNRSLEGQDPARTSELSSGMNPEADRHLTRYRFEEDKDINRGTQRATIAGSENDGDDYQVAEEESQRYREELHGAFGLAADRRANTLRLPVLGSGPAGSNAGSASVAGAQLGRVNESMSQGLEYILMRINTYVEQRAARETISLLESAAKKEFLPVEDFVRTGKAKIDPATFQKQNYLANQNIEVVAITIRRAYNGLNEAERKVVADRTPAELMKTLRLDRIRPGLGL